MMGCSARGGTSPSAIFNISSAKLRNKASWVSRVAPRVQLKDEGEVGLSNGVVGQVLRVDVVALRVERDVLQVVVEDQRYQVLDIRRWLQGRAHTLYKLPTPFFPPPSLDHPAP